MDSITLDKMCIGPDCPSGFGSHWENFQNFPEHVELWVQKSSRREMKSEQEVEWKEKWSVQTPGYTVYGPRTLLVYTFYVAV